MLRIIFLFISFFFVAPSPFLFGATFTVSSVKNHDDNNLGDGVCYTGQTAPDNCTLRAALQEANALPGADRIVFNRQLDIPYPNLPIISDPLTIDASSQWIDRHPGVSIGVGEMVICSDDTIITGLMFSGSAGPGADAGLKIECGNNVRIGGPGNGERNVFFVDNGIGVLIGRDWHGSSDDLVTIQYNHFGIVATGLFDAYGDDNQYRMEQGIGLYGNGNAGRILIEHNKIGECRIGVYDNYPYALTIRDNRIGTPDVNGYFSNRFPNGIGIYIGNKAGPVSIESNQIAENIDHQIKDENGPQTVTIDSNIIGSSKTDYSVSSSHGNGIDLTAVSQSQVYITDNTIQNINGNGLRLGIYGPQASLSVKGNNVGSNKKNGILLFGETTENNRSIISSNTIIDNEENGVLLDAARYYVVAKNTIGMSHGYTLDAGNGLDGIRIVNGSTDNLIGGAVSEDGNDIGCNRGNGIYIGGAGTRNNYVAGNVIGLEESAAGFRRAGNHQHGIALYDNSESNYIGLSGDIIDPNLILDSHWRGIAVINSNHNRLIGNLVGTNNRNRNWGNGYSGIQIMGSNNQVVENTVAHNGFTPNPHQAGIVVEGVGSFGNQLSKNSIFANGAAGIALVNGGNQNLQPPQLIRNNQILDGTTYPGALVEFFSGPDKDEGKYVEGSTLADGSGHFSWQVHGHVRGKYLTATTTNASTLSTSEFSLFVRGHIFLWPMFLPAIVNHR